MQDIAVVRPPEEIRVEAADRQVVIKGTMMTSDDFEGLMAELAALQRRVEELERRLP